MLLEIVVHHLEQARGALSASSEAGFSVQLRSAPGAAAYAGVGYLHALGKAVDHELIIDCGDAAGLVMEALRAGCRKILFSGKAETRQALVEMAIQVGAEVRHETTASSRCLTLSPDDDGKKVSLEWLSSLSDDEKQQR